MAARRLVALAARGSDRHGHRAGPRGGIRLGTAHHRGRVVLLGGDGADAAAELTPDGRQRSVTKSAGTARRPRPGPVRVSSRTRLHDVRACGRLHHRISYLHPALALQDEGELISSGMGVGRCQRARSERMFDDGEGPAGVGTAQLVDDAHPAHQHGLTLGWGSEDAPLGLQSTSRSTLLGGSIRRTLPDAGGTAPGRCVGRRAGPRCPAFPHTRPFHGAETAAVVPPYGGGSSSPRRHPL